MDKQHRLANPDKYDEKRFWRKIKRYAQKAGKEVIEKALWLYYAAERPDTPKWAKTAIYGALAYFILPIDLIPDILPGVGYTDDLGVIAAAIASVSLYINQEVRDKAKAKAQTWFGTEEDELKMS